VATSLRQEVSPPASDHCQNTLSPRDSARRIIEHATVAGSAARERRAHRRDDTGRLLCGPSTGRHDAEHVGIGAPPRRACRPDCAGGLSTGLRSHTAVARPLLSCRAGGRDRGVRFRTGRESHRAGYDGHDGNRRSPPSGEQCGHAVGIRRASASDHPSPDPRDRRRHVAYGGHAVVRVVLPMSAGATSCRCLP
jgi:hypothetical protein